MTPELSSKEDRSEDSTVSSTSRFLLLPLVQFQRARAYIAWKLKRWRTVVSAYEWLRCRGLADVVDRAGLGTAYTHLERWQDAVEVFEGLEHAELEPPRFEAARWFNHAIALYRLGRRDACTDVLAHAVYKHLKPRDVEVAETMKIVALIEPLGAFGPIREANWARVVDVLKEHRKLGVDSDYLRSFLGRGLVRLRRWQEGLDEMEAIQRPLTDTVQEGLRCIDSALALHELGRKAEARELLSKDSSSWRQQEREVVSRMLAQMERGQQ